MSGLARSVLDSLHTRMMTGLGAGERKNSSSVFRSQSQADTVTSTSLPGMSGPVSPYLATLVRKSLKM